MSGYTPSRVQEYWRHAWDRAGVYETPDDPDDPTYVLGMFPYTSGALHMGHVRNYAITDAIARFRRMKGEDVLHPMGWDAFGLPAENAAYERDTDPESWTRGCIERMRDELEEMGFGYDWSREITTCDPEYYRWNQWLFLQLREAGLVERKAAAVNWCPDCETVLADAQVERGVGPSEDSRATDDDRLTDHPGPGHDPGEGVCWRCGTPVESRDLDQYFFTITDYAEELDAGLDDLDGWPAGVREIQRDWIGRQEGAEITFDVAEYGSVDCFTTRADTVFGATFLAVAPGHDLTQSLAETDEAVAEYVDRVGEAPHDRSGDTGDEDLTGVRTDRVATNPLTGETIPIYVADYVVEDVGTGAVMGVPAHNERDYRFASQHDLPVESVVAPAGSDAADLDLPYTSEGVLVAGSDAYEGNDSASVRDALLEDADAVAAATTYRLRDWLISRQRYWGTPIPLVHCEDCGTVPVPAEDLPVELPDYVQTTGNPLAANEEFVKTECPECGGPAERETDTMDTFVDSSWYFLRYLSPHLDSAPFDQKAADEWLPVDVYVGGEEHAVLHLLYIRFFTRALADLGLLDVREPRGRPEGDLGMGERERTAGCRPQGGNRMSERRSREQGATREPVTDLINQGTVLHSGQKMSKSKGNAVAPHEYGAETTRLFVLSAAHPARDFEWTAKDVSDSYDFLQSIYGMVEAFATEDHRLESDAHDEYVERATDRTIAAVTDEYERGRFHRVVAECRRFARLLRRYREYDEPYEYAYARGLRTLTLLLAPVAPYLAEECWHLLDEDGLAAEAEWPRPLKPSDDYAIERGLVRRTLDDVREITEVAGMDPERVEIAVAPAWKYDAYEIARAADRSEAAECESGEAANRAADPNEAVVGRILDSDGMPDRETAGYYAADLQERSAGLEPILDADRELTVLQEATWLFADEFDADVTIHRASEGDLAETAEPNRPAIHVD